MSISIPTVPLSGGLEFPLLGLGTWPMKGRECADAVASALDVGYRLIDTAAQYANEAGVGAGLAASSVPREEIVVLSKLAGRDQGFAREALQVSLAKLGLDYIDVYVIHWPNPLDDLYVKSYEQLLQAKADGLIKAVGTSNFLPEHLTRLHEATGVWPEVNQIQLCPQVLRPDLVAFGAEHGIHTESWRPFGEGLLEDTVVRAVADEAGRSPSHVLLRWAVQQGFTTIPKSGNAERQRHNAEIFDWELTDEQLARLDSLDQGVPDSYDARTHQEY